MTDVAGERWTLWLDADGTLRANLITPTWGGGGVVVVREQASEAERDGGAGMNVAQHRDHFRGQCALALMHGSKITNELANAIRISPMDDCVDLGAIDACRERMAKMAKCLDAAEESARAVSEAERDRGQG